MEEIERKIVEKIAIRFAVLTVVLGCLIFAMGWMTGCKTVTVNGVATAPNLTNASLQAAHKYAMDTAASVTAGQLTLTPSEKQAFNAFGLALDAADATYIAYYKGQATQAQVAAQLAAMTAKMTAAQAAIAKGQ